MIEKIKAKQIPVIEVTDTAIVEAAGYFDSHGSKGHTYFDAIVAAIFLRTDEHIRGLMFILSIVLRAFTLIEFVVRRRNAC